MAEFRHDIGSDGEVQTKLNEKGRSKNRGKKIGECSSESSLRLLFKTELASLVSDLDVGKETGAK